MNREIKFRAWDKKENEMISEALEIKDIGLGEGSVLVDERTQKGNELIWLQFTGLRDKNGKEIYEGDILNFPETSYHLSFHSQVVFKDGKFTTEDFLSRELGELSNKSEIIGNVWETPELSEKL